MDLTQEQWEQQQVAATNAVILDVRSQEEFDQGHIPQAQLLDIRQPQAFMDGIAELDRNKTYFVYCRSGARSGQACQIMQQHGIASVYNLLGGIMEWEGAIE